MMEFQGVSRWDTAPIKVELKSRKRHFVYVGGCIVLIAAVVTLVLDLRSGELALKADVPIIYAGSLGPTASDMGSDSEKDFGEIGADLATRVEALEADNHRLNAELTQLLDHDGVIDRLVGHIRALHAQSEATRRDVVDAMTGATSENDLAFNRVGIDAALPMEAAEVPLLSKARHTIVTPIKVPSEAEEPTPPAKTRSRSVQSESDEGATN